jgi:UDP-glucose 4-epimerase
LQQNPISSILITGGTGLVGAYTAQKLSDEGANVVCFDLSPRPIDFIEGWQTPVVKGDVRKLDDLLRTIDQYSMTEIVHTAAIPSEIACRNDPAGSFEVNVKGTLNVAEASRLRDLRLIYMSSQSVYGNLHCEDLSPIKEEEVPQSICGIYSSHKMMAETIVKSFNQLYGLSTLILRPSWVYGPGQIAVQNPVSIILDRVVKKQPFILEQGGDHPLNYTYVKDLSQAVLLSIKARNSKHGAFNIDGGRLVTVREVAAAAKEAIPDAQIHVGPGYWPMLSKQSPLKGPGNLTKAQQELGYEPRYSIGEGVKEFAQYLVARARGM